jgi:2-keto-4-pentenoate hydratase/2-oxohepta-3-ene-1,7-dioic acid hydratase in catechol pathway
MAIHRIFCIGRNYAEHIAELGNEPDSDCVVFMKPPSSLVPVGAPLVLPRNQGSVHHEAELVVMLNGGGRDIPEQRASDYIGAFTLGIDLTLRDLQNELKAKGAPWERAKAFDGSAPLGSWKRYRQENLQTLEFTCRVNGEMRQHGRTADMIYPVARQISILSRSWSLQAGDAIFTGTPKGVASLVPGDKIEIASPAIGTFAWTCV